MKYVINERIIAKDGQQDVKIRTPFNEKQINVFLNGRLMNNGLDQDYVQTDEYILKSRNTCNKKYGVSHQLKNDDIKDQVFLSKKRKNLLINMGHLLD